MKMNIKKLAGASVLALGTAFAGAANATCTSGCGTQPSNTINLTNDVTANPTSTSTATANPTQIANPTSTSTATASPTQIANPTSTSTATASPTQIANPTSTSTATQITKLEGGDQTTTVGVGVGVEGNNTNIVKATTGDSNAAATVQSGAIQLNQTYKQVKQVASAIAAPAMPANVAPGNCWQVTQGASLALQSANWGVSGNMSGKAEWTEDSNTCEKFQQIRTGMASPNPAMNAAAVLIKGDDALIQDLMGQKGQDLKNFFGTTAQSTSATYTTTVAAPAAAHAPAEAPVYICPKGSAKAGQAGEVVRLKSGELALNCGM
ncbi:MAG: hypothetical protein RBR86_06355 [Pseudobdellovibrionaceae bacterium]|jgi:hypothetical protein|nr:hypothetical protein [Pseudobdellovibrionaceae bacterium]